tara:strand:+ start:123 stop:542 length:420 start_codon:yes stop_codon:yes gene_type:complete
MKLVLFLCALLLVSISVNVIVFTKLDKAKIELQTAINNQAVLERTIAEQNDQIKKAVETAKKTQQQIQSLNNQYTESQAQVTKLRSKFANFNLEGMALTEPAVLEGKVNRATARVGDDLERITSPEQFDEKTTDTATLN